MKRCIECNHELDESKFYKKGGKYKNNGYQSKCKTCFNKQTILNQKNKKFKEYLKNYYLNNKKQINQSSSNNYYLDKENRSKKSKQKYKENPKYFLSRSKQYQNIIKLDPVKLKNKKEYQNNYQKEYRIKNPHISVIRNQIKNIKEILGTSKTNTTFKELQYTSFQFKQHIDNLFKEKMDWSNIGIGEDKWNIDHKIPITWFKLNTPFYLVNNLMNLEPIWWTENIKKSNKYSTYICLEYLNLIKDWIKEEYLELIKIK